MVIIMDFETANNLEGPTSCCHGCGAPMRWDVSLRDVCCDVFAACMKLSPARIVGLVNNIFGSAHPQASKVLFPDPAPLENGVYPYQAVDLPIRIIEEKDGVETAFEYCIEFNPEYNPVLGLPIVIEAMDQSASRPDPSEIYIPAAETAVIFLLDVPDIGDKLTFHLVDPKGSDTFLYTVKVVKLFSQPRQVTTKKYLPLLPFEILRAYHKIRNAQKDRVLEVYGNCYADTLQEELDAEQRGDLSAEDLTALLDCTKLLAKAAYADLIPFLQ